MSANIMSYSGDEDIKKVKNYLFMLNEQLRYMFNNLSPEDNFNDDALRKYLQNGKDISYLELTSKHLIVRIEDSEKNVSVLQQTAKSLTTQITNAAGDISVLQQTAKSLTTQIANAAGDISVLKQTASSLTTQIANAAGDISVLKQTASSLTTRIADAEGNISVVRQTASSLTTRISNAEGSISVVRQTADKVNWLISSGSSSTNFTLSSRMASLISDRIDLAGFVTFSALSSSGKTEINGDNITTGKIDVKMLYAGGSKVFGMQNGKFSLYKDFVPSNLSLSQLSVNTISIVNGPMIRGSFGKLNMGRTYDYSTISSSSSQSEIITALNRLISWVNSVFD